MLRFREVARVCQQLSAIAKRNVLFQSARELHLVQNRNNKAAQKACADKEKQAEPLMDIKCKVAIFSSGSTGIGFAAANQLLAEGAAHVFISGNNIEEGEYAEEKLQKKFGDDKATYIPGDVRDDHHLKALFEIGKEKYENVDIFVNDAAILEDRYWKHTIDINTAGVLRTCLLGFHYMGKNDCGKGGVIVNLSSIYGLQPLPGAPVYSSSKYAVIGITQNLGDKFHFCQTCVRVVALCPGLTDTQHIKDVAHKQYNEEWGEDVEQEFSCSDKQSPEVVGKAVSYVVKMAPSASVWVIEDCKLCLAEIPDRKSYSKMVGEMK